VGLSPYEHEVLDNKWNHLQKLIDAFEHQVDSFLFHHNLTHNSSISSLGDYDEFHDADCIDNEEDLLPSYHLPPIALDGSGMDSSNPEDLPIHLPSSLGWKWCASHGLISLAAKETHLCHAQANDAIHQICLALGYKSALFCSQVVTTLD
jgi:hypothetical protein